MSTPDQLLASKLGSAASNLALIRRPRPTFEQAAAELREIAGGRTDLLAEAAGLVLGCNAPSWPDWPQHLAEARVLIAAGADQALIEKWVLIGRERSGHKSAGEPLPDVAQICATVAVLPQPAPPPPPGWDDRF